MNMKPIGKVFISGLITILPVLITAWIIVWFGWFAESIFGNMIQTVAPKQFYKPGMGLLLGLVLIFGVGLLTNAWIGQRIFNIGDEILNRIPFVKTLYGSSRDLMNLLSGSEKNKFSRVVFVNVGGLGLHLLGLVTCEVFEDLPRPEAAEGEMVVVYLPLSYQIGGLMVIVPRAALAPAGMSLEEAMRFVLTAGVSKQPAALQLAK